MNLGLNRAKLQSGLKGAKSDVGGWASGLAGVVSGPLGQIAGLVGGALAFGSSISAARTQIAAEQKLAAVLKATGGAAGLSAREIQTYAGEIQNATNFGDELIINNAAILATFKEIKGDTFKEALTAAADLSAVLDGDLKGATIQLGKALNDPTKGMAALADSGVSFTSQQQEQIRTLQESGDMLGAQRIILAELKSEFGGAAAAMADPMTQAANVMGDLGELVGFVVLPPLNAMMRLFSQSAGPATGAADSFKAVGESLAGIVSWGLKPLAAGMETAFSWVATAADTISFGFSNAGDLAALSLVEIQQGILDLLPASSETTESIVAGFGGTWAALKAGAGAWFQNIKSGFTELKNLAVAFATGLASAIGAAFEGSNPLTAFQDGFMETLAAQQDAVSAGNPFESMRDAFNETQAQIQADFDASGGIENSLQDQRQAILDRIANREQVRAQRPELTGLAFAAPVPPDTTSKAPDKLENAGVARGSREAFEKLLRASQPKNPNKKLEDLTQKQVNQAERQTQLLEQVAHTPPSGLGEFETVGD